MGVLSFQMDFPGQVGVNPRRGKLITTDSLSTITTAGYLNSQTLMGQTLYPTDFIDVIYAYDPNTNSGTDSVFTVSISGTGVITLAQDVVEGNVVFPVIDGDFAVYSGTAGKIKDLGYLPSDATKTKVVMANAAVLANHIAVYADTAGTVNDDAATAINNGNIQAGLDASAGTFISFPGTTASGTLRVAAVDSSADVAVTISNADHAQATVVSIPDGGQATTEFIIADNAGTQHITSGALQVDAGAISSGLAAGGFVGNFIAYPTTTANGYLELLAADNAGGDFHTIITTAGTIGQSQTISLPDSGAATANFILSASSGSSQTLTSGLSFTGGGTNIQTTGGGNFLAGSSGAAGAFYAYPATATSGSLGLVPVDNATGDFDTNISNAAAVAQDQTITIPDVGQATGSFLVSTLSPSDVNANLIYVDVTVAYTDLATAGSKVLYTSSGSKQYRIREIFMNSGGTNFSGGGGDRLGEITDGTTSYSVIPAANMQALTNDRWGSTAVAYPAAASINTATAAGANIVMKYNGGATDYTAGSVVMTLCLERIA